MGRSIGSVAQQASITNLVPIGGVAPVFRSGDAYKAIGEVVQRSVYAALSAAFPRNGAFSSFTSASPPSATWKGAAYGNGVFVGVSGSATSSTAMVSTDGLNWEPTIIPAAIWTSVSFGNGVFVAVSTSNVCATSTDGRTWTVGAMPAGSTWTAVTFGSGKFVAVSNTAPAAYSTDGIAWTSATLPSSTTWNSVTYGSGKFLVVSTTTAAATSPDGITWTARTLPASAAASVNAVASSGALFVYISAANNGCYSSADGITWTARNVPCYPANQFTSVAWGDGVWLIYGSGTAFVSYDGIAWFHRAIPSTQNMFVCAYGAGRFASVGPGSSPTTATVIYTENLTDSDYLYLSGTAGQFVRVK